MPYSTPLSGQEPVAPVLAHQVNALMSELSRQGMARKVANGVLPCCAPIGYRNYQKKIEIDPVLAPFVRESFERAATSGLPLRRLLDQMTRRGLVSRGGKPLKVSAFWYMLNNPFYAGQVRWNGKLVPGSHEPLIGPEVLNAVRERLGKSPNESVLAHAS